MNYIAANSVFLGFSGMNVSKGSEIAVDPSEKKANIGGRPVADFRDVEICISKGIFVPQDAKHEDVQDKPVESEDAPADKETTEKEPSDKEPAQEKKSRVGNFKVVKTEDSARTIEVPKTPGSDSAEPNKNVSQKDISDIPVKKGKVVGESHGLKIIKSDASEESGVVVKKLPKCTPSSKK